LGVAVSGGGDSTALLLLLADWAKTQGVALFAATVDHGLRPEAAAEAAAVSTLCASIKVPHQTLLWQGWDHQGNLQDQARQARHRLLADWAQAQNIDTIALGHTIEDQAETLVQRLLRGSGVDGLSAMARVANRSGIRWIRPLLHHHRADLREFLRNRDQPWFDDPSNENDAFGRIRIRKLMAGLDLSPSGLAETAARMQRTRHYLETETAKAARLLARVTVAGDVELDHAAVFALHPEIRLRLMSHSLKWVSGSPYRPRLASLSNLLAKIENPGKSTLAGCIAISERGGVIRIGREYRAVRDVRAGIDAAWDTRWRVTGPDASQDITVAALGNSGLADCPDWRATGLPRDSLIASPALWRGDALVAAPLAARPAEWQVKLEKGPEHYFTSILSH